MNWGEALERIITLVVVLQILRGLVQRVTGAKAAAAEGPVPLEKPPALAEPASLAEWATQARLRLADGVERARDLELRLEDCLHQLDPNEARAADLRAAIRHPTQEALETTRLALEVGLAAAEAGGPEQLVQIIEEAPRYTELFRALAQAQLRTEAIESLTRARVAELGYLGDADAVARALLAPLAEFAAAQGVRLPRQRPICVPADERGEAVILGLFPQHPVVFVPRDFAGELLRWPAVAHELGHILWRALPGFAAEASRLARGKGPAPLPSVHGDRLLFDADAALATWQMELFCDLFAVLLTGPAGLRGLIHAFEDPGDPHAVVQAHATLGGRSLDEHPPAELRVRLAARVADRLGFDREAIALLRGWRAQHGELPHLVLPTLLGAAVRVPIEPFEAEAWALLERILDHPFNVLAGHTLESIPGLPVGPGLWGRALRRAEDLATGEPFNDDARVVIMAGVEAAAHKSSAHLLPLLRQAIRGAGEYRVSDPRYGGDAGDAEVLTPADVVDAMILHSLLNGGRGAWRRRG